MRSLITLMVAATSMAAGCGSGSFTLTGASVDPTYTCPVGANNAPYDLHAIVDVHNGTSTTVTIKSMTAEMTLEAITGLWLEKVGDRYEAGNLSFAPASVASGSNATLKVTIPSACTNAKATNSASAGDYRVTIHLVTSAGTYSISSKNRHLLVAA